MASMGCPSASLSLRVLDLVLGGFSSGSISYVVPRRRECRGGVRCRVSSTQDDLGSGGVPTVRSSSGTTSLASLLEVVSDDLHILNENLKSIVGAENPVLASVAEQIFGAGGKRLRPAIVFLVSRATAQIADIKDLTTQHRSLAEIIEMIHTASLIHDDVPDDSGMRRVNLAP